MNAKLKSWISRTFLLALVAVLMVGLAYTVPLDLALIGAIDMATYIDALVGVYLIAQVARLRPIIGASRAWVATRFWRRRQRPIVTRRLTKAPPANDDDRPVALAA